MTHIPLEAEGVLHFTPKSLENTLNPPVFRLAVGTRRDRELLTRRVVEEGYESVSNDELHEELLRGLKAGWNDEAFEKYESLIRGYWQAQEDWQHDNLSLAAADREAFSFEGLTEEELQDIGREVLQSWRPLREMAARNTAMARGWPLIVCSVIIAGWSNLDVPFARVGGKISVETAYEIREMLDGLDKAAGISDDQTDAFTELYIECSKRLYLPKELEKNSQSPSTSEPTQQVMATGAALPSGTSPIAEPSTTTPEASSETSITASLPPMSNATEG